MSRRLAFALVLPICLAIAEPALGSFRGRESVHLLRIAQAESEFEETQAPAVTLEEPKNLERSGEPIAGGGPDVPVPPPPEEAPVPEWWKKAQQALDQAINDQTGEGPAQAGEGTEPSGKSGTDRGMQLNLSRNIIQSAIALCAVIALILLCTWLIKRLGARTPLLAGASLGTVLGKVYLTPKIALHFVKVRNVVLVIGVTPNGVSPVAQLNAALFDDVTQGSASGRQNDRQLDFLSHLTSETERSPAAQSTENEDDEITALKGDLARLQKYLQETSRELGD